MLPHSIAKPLGGLRTISLDLGVCFPASMTELRLSTWDTWTTVQTCPDEISLLSFHDCPALRTLHLSKGPLDGTTAEEVFRWGIEMKTGAVVDSDRDDAQYL